MLSNDAKTNALSTLMILYLSSSDKIENIEKFESIIEKHNLWNLISANPLPIDFIRKNKEKIDWKIASIVNKFTESERIEFNDLIIIYTDVVPLNDLTEEVYTVSDIRKLIKLFRNKIKSSGRLYGLKFKYE